MELKIINRSGNPNPSYATHGSAGMDIRASLDEPVRIEPMGRRLIPTGLFVEIPLGYELQLRPRSGLAVKKGLTLLNTPGTIDSDYRGEIKVILINLSNETQIIENGDRIAQMVAASALKVQLKEVDLISDSERGIGGFGHSGIQ